MRKETLVVSIILFFAFISALTCIATIPVAAFFIVKNHSRLNHYLTFCLAIIGIFMSGTLLAVLISFKPALYELGIFGRTRSFFDKINKWCPQKKLLIFVIAFFYQEVVFVY